MNDKLQQALAFLGEKHCLHPSNQVKRKTRSHHVAATFKRAKRKLARTGRAF